MQVGSEPPRTNGQGHTKQLKSAKIVEFARKTITETVNQCRDIQTICSDALFDKVG